ncbi:MAG: peptide deformylase [Chloroflexota bacterium]|nr:peptide deformylase [Chloroflexota bacterium]MDQ5867893.1 peptide deformylase [Chloroflexota bacterium]
MAVLDMVYDPNPILREKARRIKTFDASLRKLVADMFETMRVENGVGLAAPQINQSIRLLVIEILPDRREGEKGVKVVLCNPEIVKASDEMVSDLEACLSIRGWYGEVPRHRWVVVKAQNPEGKEVRIKAEDYYARVLQHEIDHLNGILFTDRVVDISTLRRIEPETSEEQSELAEV